MSCGFSPPIVLAAKLDPALRGASRPKIVLIRVDLPAPLGPTMVTISPSRTVIETPLRMSTSADVAGDDVLGLEIHLGWAFGVMSRVDGFRAASIVRSPAGAAEVGVDHGLVGADLVRLAVGDHRALGHHDHPVGVVHHHLHVVLDEQEGDPVLGAQALHVVEQPPAEGRVDARHRLVEQQEARLRHQRPGELEQLALAAGERAGVLVGEPGRG